VTIYKEDLMKKIAMVFVFFGIAALVFAGGARGGGGVINRPAQIAPPV
jgi:hypothetical protein